MTYLSSSWPLTVVQLFTHCRPAVHSLSSSSPLPMGQFLIHTPISSSNIPFSTLPLCRILSIKLLLLRHLIGHCIYSWYVISMNLFLLTFPRSMGSFGAPTTRPKAWRGLSCWGPTPLGPSGSRAASTTHSRWGTPSNAPGNLLHRLMRDIPWGTSHLHLHRWMRKALQCPSLDIGAKQMCNVLQCPR